MLLARIRARAGRGDYAKTRAWRAWMTIALLAVFAVMCFASGKATNGLILTGACGAAIAIRAVTRRIGL
jgi:hypothetical protein